MRILLVTFDYLPYSIGGTEVYVAGLARELKRLGHDIHILITSHEIREDYDYEGIPVHYLSDPHSPAASRHHKAEPGTLIYPYTEETAEQYLRELQPDIIHSHPLYLTPMLPVMAAARRLGIPSLCTYHTPTITCGRGNMTKWGKYNCDGRLDWRQCSACVLQQKGLPKYIAELLPLLFGHFGGAVRRLQGLPLPRKIRSMFRILSQRQMQIREWETAREAVDCWIAVAKWVEEVLIINNVSPDNIFLSRQGLCYGSGGNESPADAGQCRDGTGKGIKPAGTHDETYKTCRLRLGYIGRIQPQKGIHIMLRAMRLLKGRNDISLVIAGVDRSKKNRYQSDLINSTRSDARIVWQDRLMPDRVGDFMKEIDFLVIPSLWLETGPMTVLEAWAQGIPIIGSNLAGITEWVEECGGGLLFERGNPEDMKKTILKLLENPGSRRNILVPESVRTIAEVARETDSVYNLLMSRKGVAVKC